MKKNNLKERKILSNQFCDIIFDYHDISTKFLFCDGILILPKQNIKNKD